MAFGRKRNEKLAAQIQQEKKDYTDKLHEGQRLSQFNGLNGNGYQPIPNSCPMPKVKPPRLEPDPRSRFISKLQSITSEFEEESGVQLLEIKFDRTVNTGDSFPFPLTLICGCHLKME